MKYGIAQLSIVPMRKEPSERSEMTSQILFGEHYEILEEQNDWLYISLEFDGYCGWIDRKMNTDISDEFVAHLRSYPACVTNQLEMVHSITSKMPQYILPGSSLPMFSETDKSFKIENKVYNYAGTYKKVGKDTDTSIVKLALRYLESPYLWGGRTPFGIDCSGFTQIIYKMAGISIKRDANQQALMGQEVSLGQNAGISDLAFFGESPDKITHVGILLNSDEIIHANGYVRIDNLDKDGIISVEKKQYTHHLQCIKSFQ